jgi:hypothetical protein
LPKRFERRKNLSDTLPDGAANSNVRSVDGIVRKKGLQLVIDPTLVLITATPDAVVFEGEQYRTVDQKIEGVDMIKRHLGYKCERLGTEAVASVQASIRPFIRHGIE